MWLFCGLSQHLCMMEGDKLHIVAVIARVRYCVTAAILLHGSLLVISASASMHGLIDAGKYMLLVTVQVCGLLVLWKMNKSRILCLCTSCSPRLLRLCVQVGHFKRLAEMLLWQVLQLTCVSVCFAGSGTVSHHLPSSAC